jgi:hypothetical protein
VTSLRRFLLVIVLVAAQWAAGAHAVEHGVAHQDRLAHACAVCLLAHDLGSGLPTVANLPLLQHRQSAPPALAAIGRSAFPPPRAVQRGPPVA